MKKFARTAAVAVFVFGFILSAYYGVRPSPTAEASTVIVASVPGTSITGLVADTNQAPQTLAGDVRGLTDAGLVYVINGPTPINVNPEGGTTSLSIDTTGAVIGKTASSNIGTRIAPLVGSETAYAGIWIGTNATSPSSGNYLFALSPAGTTLFNGTALQLTGTLITQGIEGQQSFPLFWVTTAGAIACGTGGTQTVSAAQSATPGLNVTWTTLASNCVVDFTTNAVTGWYQVSLAGTSLGSSTLGFKNGTTTRTISAAQFTALTGSGFSGVTVWPHGTNLIDLL